MPHHKSAEKRLRQTEKRTVVNRSRLSRVRTFVKNVESAIETGDKATAQSAFTVAQPELHRATTKGVMHKNTVARKLSRLASTRSERSLGHATIRPALASQCFRGVTPQRQKFVIVHVSVLLPTAPASG